MSTLAGTLNQRTAGLTQKIGRQADKLRIQVIDDGIGAVVMDFGIEAAGGLAAGITLARVCLADLAAVEIVPGQADIWPGPAVAVHTDHPIEACLASQYAGWQITGDRFFAMASGPMRSLTGKEDLFKELGYPEHEGFRSSEAVAVGVLETAVPPPREVALEIAAACDVDIRSLVLLVAPTDSIAGHIQVVARSIETALHKLHELRFDLARVVSGFGTAPLPPIARNDKQGIGRTNDAVLYGGQVTLWVRGDDASLEEIITEVPSCASQDFGRPFGEVFASYDYDFYKIDPHLFSPAVIQFVNLETGHSFRAGEVRADVLRESFA
jgi:methenyltetrahydromethanopterin cyclohydrolase